MIENHSSLAVVKSETAIQMHQSIRLAARFHFIPARCLARSIVLTDMLIVRGLNAKLVIGVTKKGGVFASHAWVELDGAAVAEPESIQQNFIVIK